MRHLLVTNDFPPKIGGIQSYLWELWRRLPARDVTVLTSSYDRAQDFDDAQPFRVERDAWWLLPTPRVARRINALAAEVGAELIVLDPALPLALVGPHLAVPYVVLGHGAEVAVPSRVPVAADALRRALRHSVGFIASGQYIADVVASWSVMRDKPVISIPPGVDAGRFVPLRPHLRRQSRKRFGLPPDAQLVVGVSRLVRRKGFDRVIDAIADLVPRHPKVHLAIAGTGREGERLQAQAARLQAPVTFLGRVPDEDLPRFLGCGDIFAMACHDRWLGLEREGFGIVFNEAAACGLPVVAGRSGGSAEAVLDGRTGAIVGGNVTSSDLAAAIESLLADQSKREAFGVAGRARAVDEFNYDTLAKRLEGSLAALATGANV